MNTNFDVFLIYETFIWNERICIKYLPDRLKSHVLIIWKGLNFKDIKLVQTKPKDRLDKIPGKILKSALT